MTVIAASVDLEGDFIGPHPGIAHVDRTGTGIYLVQVDQGLNVHDFSWTITPFSRAEIDDNIIAPRIIIDIPDRSMEVHFRRHTSTTAPYTNTRFFITGNSLT